MRASTPAIVKEQLPNYTAKALAAGETRRQPRRAAGAVAARLQAQPSKHKSEHRRQRWDWEDTKRKNALDYGIANRKSREFGKIDNHASSQSAQDESAILR